MSWTLTHTSRSTSIMQIIPPLAHSLIHEESHSASTIGYENSGTRRRYHRSVVLHVHVDKEGTGCNSIHVPHLD